MQPTRHIDLRLPRHWNQCTTEELELIAKVTHDCLSRVDRYHPFDPQQVKVALFFLFAHLTVLGKGENEKGEVYYEVIRDCDKKKHSFLPSLFTGGGGGGSFPLFLWQINYWINGESGKPQDKKKKVKPGILDWLDASNPNGLTAFPYSELRLRKQIDCSFFASRFSIKSLRRKTFASPGPIFSTASYEQYRTAQDYMQLYTRLQNQLLRAEETAKKNGVQDDASLLALRSSLNEAKAKFLASIFIAKTDYIDTHTGMPKHDYHYASSQVQDNYRYFLDFPDTKFQVMLYWWSGIMRHLASKFPHIFKISKVENKVVVSPLDVYTNTIASLQKYTSLTEESLNTQLHTVTLKDLDNMVHEAEEIEKLRKK